MSEETKKTPEELQKEAKEYAEKKKAEWDALLEDLEANSDEPVTKGSLAKALRFLEEDLMGIGQMVGINAQNTQVLNHNFQALAKAISGGGQGPQAGPRTPGGIILPH